MVVQLNLNSFYIKHNWSFSVGKLRQLFFRWLDRQIEKSMQRQANKLFMKHKVKTTDGDNT